MRAKVWIRKSIESSLLMRFLLVWEAWFKEITNELLDAFTTTGTIDDVLQKTEEFSEIAMPILQTTGLDVNDANDVLEAGFYGT